MSQHKTAKRQEINEYHTKLVKTLEKQWPSDLISLHSHMIAEIDQLRVANLANLEASDAAGLLTTDSSPFAAGFCAVVEKATLELLVPAMQFPCAALVVFSSYCNKNFDECLRKWHAERRNNRREIMEYYDPEIEEMCSREMKFDWKKVCLIIAKFRSYQINCFKYFWFKNIMF